MQKAETCALKPTADRHQCQHDSRLFMCMAHSKQAMRTHALLHTVGTAAGTHWHTQCGVASYARPWACSSALHEHTAAGHNLHAGVCHWRHRSRPALVVCTCEGASCLHFEAVAGMQRLSATHAMAACEHGICVRSCAHICKERVRASMILLSACAATMHKRCASLCSLGQEMVLRQMWSLMVMKPRPLSCQLLHRAMTAKCSGRASALHRRMKATKTRTWPPSTKLHGWPRTGTTASTEKSSACATLRGTWLC